LLRERWNKKGYAPPHDDLDIGGAMGNSVVEDQGFFPRLDRLVGTDELGSTIRSD